MALQFILGNSGSGKTSYIQNELIRLAKESPKKSFFMIVPEQFTMQTHRKLVELHPGHSLFNIDVLSFGRLSHRVFDELGGVSCRVLEETGKSLILRRVAQEKAQELTVLKKNMTKMGYIGEVKSLISELAQYSVTPSQLREAAEKLPKGSFSYKLNDVTAMYQGFLEFMEGRFTTAEETLSLLSDVVGQSALLKGSVIALDGFTGFTPLQSQLLKKLLAVSGQMYVTATMDVRESPYRCSGVHELFYMSKKMVRSLQKMADALHIPVSEPIFLGHTEKSRFASSDALFFLEQNLFRSPKERHALPKEDAAIQISSLKGPREEFHCAAREIARLVRVKGYRYREIAIVCGNLPGYVNYAKEVFAEYRIPLFIDQKTTVAYHPFIEFLRAALEVVLHDFSQDGVFRYLRSGLSGILREDVDRLENYCLAAGIRGYRKWKEPFCYLPRGYEEESLSALNETRKKVMDAFEGLYASLKEKGITVEGQTMAFYRFIRERDAQMWLKRKEEAYTAAGDLKNAKEYAQIYRIVMDLLDKLVELLGDEAMSLKEYAAILDAGYEAAKVGILPPGYDRVVFGDIERTRLEDVRALFFVGINDGVIPKKEGEGGILSQVEREALGKLDLELAPSVRERAFMQKFYLYLSLTKPSERLYLSYARVDGEGKALKSAYLIHTIVKMYENLSVREVEEEPFLARIVTPENSRELFVTGLTSAAEWAREGKEEEISHWAALCRWYEAQGFWKEEALRLIDAARFRHTDTPISSAVTRLLYGTVLENSVTRLEAFAACAFSHFLSYGLRLKEREESGFYAVDMGNVFHEALERYANGMKERKHSWFTITEEESDALIAEALEQTILANHNLALFETARSQYAKERMGRILKRTVGALLHQVRQGKFTPDSFEVSFSNAEDLQSVNFRLSEEEKMRLRGRIDRIDTYQKDDTLYVKVIDYKSGGTSFQFLNVYYGLQLQLVVYMNAALEMMKKRHPGSDVVPAGIFYYHVNDPLVEAEEALSEDELRKRIFKELKLNGVVNEDREALEGLDGSLRESGVSSDVIPVGLNKDGSLKKTSKTMSAKDFAAMSAYVNETILRLGQRMTSGEASVSPYALAEKTGCDYCEFRSVCQFDPRLPGFAYRRLEELSKEELLEQMRGEEGP